METRHTQADGTEPIRLLHSADLHLRRVGDERWQALQALIQKGNEQGVNALFISGDLFDSGVKAVQLRAEIRAELEQAAFPVYIIPGNHDQQAYPEGTFLGGNVHLIQHLHRPQRLGNLWIWGFPFQDLKSQDILHALHQAAAQAEEGGTHLLMLHGELLDITGGWAEYGEEGQQSYFPIRLAYFQDLPWQYVLAGHFHTRFDVHRIEGEKYFVYPGSPVSVSRKEVGRRQAHLLEIGQPPRSVPLDTFHYERREFVLNPGPQADFLESVQAAVDQAHPQAQLLVSVRGYFDREQIGLNEAQLKQVLERFLGDRGELDFQAVDVQQFLATDLVTAFEGLLAEEEEPAEVKALARDLFFQAMIKANAD
ncbi:MAG: hypothetical protein D6715_12335 [Calditrichaeota bacterium]|nr:MAG: hypothetical protein D6715_12335 [Calditrichota bacterium]